MPLLCRSLFIKDAIEFLEDYCPCEKRLSLLQAIDFLDKCALEFINASRTLLVSLKPGRFLLKMFPCGFD